MKVRFVRLFWVVIPLILLGVIGMEESFAEERILMLVENSIKITYYTGENIFSAFSDLKSYSVIFETANNATLDVAIPKLHKHGEELFVLRNGEESIVDKQTDDCFHYVTLQTQSPEKIEFILAYWPEQYTKLVDNCEKISTAPLKQLKFGIGYSEILCKQGLELVTKSSNSSPACVNSESVMKLIERGWAKPIPSLFRDESELGFNIDLKEPITSENINERLEITMGYLDTHTFDQATILQTDIDYISKHVVVVIPSKEFSEEMTAEYYEEKLEEWIPFDTRILVARVGVTENTN